MAVGHCEVRRQESNVCQAGHRAHDTKVIDTVQGPFTVYDWKKYYGFAGYCPGQDDVSMSLDLYGSWEASDWDRVRTSEWPSGYVLDFGSHIGWYSITAAQLGHTVIAIDADAANCELLAINARHRGLDVKIINDWVENLDPMSYEGVRFIKSDVEGSEIDVVKACQSIIIEQMPVLLLECSPEFDDYYPALIEQLRGYGYTPSDELGATQKNVWFQ